MGVKKIGGRLLVGTWKVLGKCLESSGVSASQSAWVWALQSCGGMWAWKVRGKCVESCGGGVRGKMRR